jgi:HSP20 family protein
MKLRDVVPWRRSEAPVASGLSEVDSTFGSLHREMNRLFEEYLGRGGLARFSMPAEACDFSPKVDVVDSPSELVVTAELPGLSDKEVDISVTKDRLLLKGERKREESKTEDAVSYYESSYGAFTRVIPLGFAVDEDKIEAKLSNGVLRVRLPKIEGSGKEVRKISIHTC